jgi:hypothetical protein
MAIPLHKCVICQHFQQKCCIMTIIWLLSPSMTKSNKYYASNNDGSIFCVRAKIPSHEALVTFHLLREIKGTPDRKIGEVSIRLLGDLAKSPYLTNFQLEPGLSEKVGQLLYASALKYLREETEHRCARIETLHNRDTLRKSAILSNFEKSDEYITDGKKIIIYSYDLEFMRHAPDLMRLIDYQLQKRVDTPLPRR